MEAFGGAILEHPAPPRLEAGEIQHIAMTLAPGRVGHLRHQRVEPVPFVESHLMMSARQGPRGRQTRDARAHHRDLQRRDTSRARSCSRRPGQAGRAGRTPWTSGCSAAAGGLIPRTLAAASGTSSRPRRLRADRPRRIGGSRNPPVGGPADGSRRRPAVAVTETFTETVGAVATSVATRGGTGYLSSVPACGGGVVSVARDPGRPCDPGGFGRRDVASSGPARRPQE